MTISRRSTLFLLFLFIGFQSAGLAQEDAETVIEPSLLGHIDWRSIGPCNMGARMTDIEGVPGRPHILYFGSASSGLWKTVNGAITSTPIFDDQPVHSIGGHRARPQQPRGHTGRNR